MKYARIANGTVIDVTHVVPSTLYTADFAAQFSVVADDIDVGWVLLDKITDQAVVPGKTWRPPRSIIVEFEPGKFRYEQTEAAPAPVSSEPTTPKRQITVLAFRHRFTMGERVAITYAGKQNSVQGASIQSYLDDVQAASYIDLDRPDTRDGVLAMETGGLLGAGRALEILDAPIQSNEHAPE